MSIDDDECLSHVHAHKYIARNRTKKELTIRHRLIKNYANAEKHLCLANIAFLDFSFSEFFFRFSFDLLAWRNILTIKILENIRLDNIAPELRNYPFNWLFGVSNYFID